MSATPPPDAGGRAGTYADRFRAGVRVSAALAVGVAAIGISFGIAAKAVGLAAPAAIALSALTSAGASQFAAVAVLASGGTVAAALGALALMNARYLTIGVALARSLPGGPYRRALQAQALNDTAVVLAARGDGTYDRWVMFGAAGIQYAAWVGGTAIGALGGGVLGSPESLGLDAIFPTFFAALLVPELRDRSAVRVAAGAAALALVLVPLTPPGAPLFAASLLALVGARWRRSRQAQQE